MASPLDARPITGRTSGRPIRTPPPAAPPLACGITVGRSPLCSAIGTADGRQHDVNTDERMRPTAQ